MTTALATKQPTDIAGLLEVNKRAILQALPRTVKADRFLRVCLNAIARNPDLQKCTANSLYAGIVQSAQFGLEIGLMNQAHLVPYWNSEKRCFEAQFQIGYLGLRDLAERYGDVTDGDAQAVHEKDFFDYGQGDTPFVTHKPSKDQDRGGIVHFYAWAKPKDGHLKIAVLSKEDVEKHRDRFVRKTKDGKFGPAWTVTFEAMGIKTVMRRCYKLLARSPELRAAIALDEMEEISIPQHLGMEAEIEQRDAARTENTKKLEQLQSEGAPAVTEERAAVFESAGTEPTADAPSTSPADLMIAKIRRALTSKDVTDCYHETEESLKGEVYPHYTKRLKELKGK